MKTLWAFLNSKVGLLLIGFSLTSVFGALLTSRIERATLEHRLRTSRLHEDRAVAIRALNDKVVDVEENLKNLYYNYRPIGISPAFVEPEDVVASVRDLRRMFEKSRIFFSPELSNRLDQVCLGFENAMREMEKAYIRRKPDTAHGIAPDFDQTAFLQHFDRSKQARQELEREFRIIMGVM